MFAKSFECCPYKIVFMDCAMPVLNGYGANEKIIKFQDSYAGLNKPKNRIPVVALTADVT